MYRQLLAFFLYFAAHAVQAADELSVTVTEGPTECDKAEMVREGKEVSVHYEVSFDESSAAGEPKGEVFESSYGAPGGAYTFTFGMGEVIDGWDEGLKDLCKGAKATLIIPPELAYKNIGNGFDIPADATLKFDVEIVEVEEQSFFAKFDNWAIVIPILVALGIVCWVYLAKKNMELIAATKAEKEAQAEKLDLQ